MVKSNEKKKIVVLRSGTDLETNRSGGAQYQKRVIDALKEAYDVSVVYVYCKERANFSTAKKIVEFIKMIIRIRRASKTNADVFLLDRRTMLFFKRYTGEKYIGINHHYWVPSGQNVVGKLFLVLSTRIGFRRVDTLIAVSKYWRDCFKSLGAKDVRIIYNAFEANEFSGEELESFKSKYNLNRGMPIIYIGNNSREKGVVEVYEKLKDKNYLLVTSGLQNTDIPVLHYDLPFEDYLKLLAVSSLAITMSKLPEGWSRNAHEAMLMKTPVIGSGIAGMGELLESGGQIICREIDYLSSLVDNLLGDEEKMKDMSLKGYMFAKNFTKETFNQEWIDLIENAI